MESRSKNLIKNVGILTISNFASKILVFLLVPLYTSVLSTEDVGIFDLMVSTVSLLVPILSLNIVDAVMRFSMDKAKSKEDVAIVGIKFIFFSIIVAIISMIIISRLNFFAQIEGLEFLIVLYFISYVMNTFMIQFSKGLERIVDMGIAGVIGTIAVIGTNILFLIVFRKGLMGFFIANILGQAIPALYLIIRVKIWNYIKTVSVNKILQKEMLIYCTPLIATTIGWWVNNASDKYVVSLICGLSANGILSVSYKIPQVINTLHGIFTQAWQLTAVKEIDSDDSAIFYGRSFSVLCVLLAVSCSCLIILSKPLAFFLYQKDFYVAWRYVPFLLISCVLNSASGFYGSILSAKKDSKSMAMSAFYGSLANVIMNIILVYFVGIQGATIATVISSFIIFEVRKRAVGKEILINKYGIVLLTWLLLCVQAVFEIYTSFWWVEIILMFGLFILNWKGMVDILSMVKNILYSSK